MKTLFNLIPVEMQVGEGGCGALSMAFTKIYIRRNGPSLGKRFLITNIEGIKPALNTYL